MLLAAGLIDWKLFDHTLTFSKQDFLRKSLFLELPKWSIHNNFIVLQQCIFRDFNDLFLKYHFLLLIQFQNTISHFLHFDSFSTIIIF